MEFSDEERLEKFVASIDPGLIQYRDELVKYAVTSENTLRFLRPREVSGMQIPNVYKRMLIEKIVNLQTPESKRKLKEESEGIEENCSSKYPPKRLRYDDNNLKSDHKTSKTFTCSSLDENDNVKEVAKSTTMEKEIDKMAEERDCLRLVISQKKDELAELKSPPVQLKPLPIPGLPAINVVCDNCHHKGHRVSGNRGGQKCPYVQCSGYHYCGNESKHKEYRQKVSEFEKEVQSLEKKCKDLDNEIEGIRNFIKHNNSSFISAVRPKLIVSNPIKYRGKDGNNNLQRDLRLIKLATGGKIPTTETKEGLCALIETGKSKLVATGIEEETYGTDLGKCIGKPISEVAVTSSNHGNTNTIFNTTPAINANSNTVSNPTGASSSPVPQVSVNPFYQPSFCMPPFGYSGFMYSGSPYGNNVTPYGTSHSPYGNITTGNSTNPYGDLNFHYNWSKLDVPTQNLPRCTKSFSAGFSCSKINPPLPKEKPPENPPLPPGPAE